MKEEGKSYIEILSEKVKVSPKLVYIKRSELIKKLKSSLDEIEEEDLKIYGFVGAKSKVQFQQFPAVITGIRQIYDATGIFRTIPQLDALCHLIGYQILQYLFIDRKGIELSSQTKKFTERENIRNFRGQLSFLEKDIRNSFDLFTNNLMDKDAFMRDIDDLISGFSTQNGKNAARQFVDDWLGSEEYKIGVQRSKWKIAKRKYREHHIGEVKYLKPKEI